MAAPPITNASLRSEAVPSLSPNISAASSRSGLTSLGCPPIYTQTSIQQSSLPLQHTLIPPIVPSIGGLQLNPPMGEVAHPYGLGRRTVFLSNEEVIFPVTAVGDRSMFKLRVCNRENTVLEVSQSLWQLSYCTCTFADLIHTCLSCHSSWSYSPTHHSVWFTPPLRWSE